MKTEEEKSKNIANKKTSYSKEWLKKKNWAMGIIVW